MKLLLEISKLLGMKTTSVLIMVMLPMTVVASQSVTSQPIGPHLCRFMFKLVYECSYYKFSSAFLHCQLQNCSSRIVYYKFSRYTLKMSLGQRANFTDETVPTAGKDPRILLISKSTLHDSYQMDLSNTSNLSLYNHLKQQKVSALVYLGSTQKLLVSNKERNKIYAYSLDSSNFSVVVSNHSTEHFGLDESRYLIFFYSKKLMSKHGCLVRMQDNGSNLTIIKRLQGQVARSHVTVESRNRKLYMNVKYSSIDVYSYSGHLEGQLFADTPNLKGVRILAFDQETLDLYYIEDKTLFKVSLEDKQPIEIHRFRRNARQLVKHMGKLYVALMRKVYLYVISQDKQGQMIKLNFDTYDDWNMCIVS